MKSVTEPPALPGGRILKIHNPLGERVSPHLSPKWTGTRVTCFQVSQPVSRVKCPPTCQVHPPNFVCFNYISSCSSENTESQPCLVDLPPQGWVCDSVFDKETNCAQHSSCSFTKTLTQWPQANNSSGNKGHPNSQIQ